MGYPRSYGENGVESFQEGDVVFLKSGSMPMTVSAVLSPTKVGSRVQVIWQNYYGDVRMKEFSVLVITATQPEFCFPRDEDDDDD